MKKLFISLKPLALSIILITVLSFQNFGQDSKDQKVQNETYAGGIFYEVQHYNQPARNKKPKNIILMIGDGMGLAQLYSGMTANGGHLFMENFKNCGFSKTVLMPA